MSNALFPRKIYGMTQNVPKIAEFSTIVQKGSDPANTTRIAQTQNPIWHWEFTFEQLFDDLTNPNYVYSELQTLFGFCLSMRGQRTTFFLDDPSDDFVGPALDPDGSPNLQAQLQVVNDGAGNYYSPIQRNFGGQFYEDITDLNGPIVVYANSALQANPADYTILGPGLAIPGASFAGLYLKWVTAPAEPVTAELNFYFHVRFETDTTAFEQFLYGLWTAGGTESNKSEALRIMTERRKT